MISESDVTAYVRKGLSGGGLDYLTVNTPSSRTSKSWQEHAKVITDGKSEQEICSETWGHIEDIIANATADGAGEAAAKLLLYRSKAPAGSRVFRTDITGGNNEEQAPANANASLADALVKTNHDLRMMITDTLKMVEVSSAAGWKMAADLAKDNRVLAQENTELKIVRVVEQNESDDTMREITKKVIGDGVEILKNVALAKIAQASLEG